MPDVLIVVEPTAVEPGSGTLIPAVAQMVSALKQAILSNQNTQSQHPSLPAAFERVKVVETVSLTQKHVDGIGAGDYPEGGTASHRICPLALDLPEMLRFPAATVYQACRNVMKLRQQVETWQYLTGSGNFWLPIVLTAKGPLFAEAIGCTDPDAVGSAFLLKTERLPHQPRYIQPVHLGDRHRQPLYELGYRLLRSLPAVPGVYLLQFGLGDDGVCFDRLLPFPAAPAIASLGTQVPDLFTCHWHCMIGKAIRDLTIRASSRYSTVS